MASKRELEERVAELEEALEEAHEALGRATEAVEDALGIEPEEEPPTSPRD